MPITVLIDVQRLTNTGRDRELGEWYSFETIPEQLDGNSLVRITAKPRLSQRNLTILFRYIFYITFIDRKKKWKEGVSQLFIYKQTNGRYFLKRNLDLTMFTHH